MVQHRLRLLSRLAVALATATTSPARAGSPAESGGVTIVGNEITEIRDRIQALGGSMTIYPDPDSSKKLLYATPWTVFEADERGRLRVDVERPWPGQERAKVTIYLLVSPADEMAAVTRRIAADSALSGLPYRDIRSSQLITLSTLVWVVEPEPGSGIPFRGFHLDGFANLTRIALEAEFPPDQAELVAERLRRGELGAKFRVRCTLNATRSAVSRVEARVAHEVVVQAINKVVGEAAGPRANAGRTGLALDGGRVTRDQAGRIEAEALRDLEVRYQISDPAHLEILRKDFADYFARIFTTVTVDQDFGEALARHRDLRFDSRDLKPGEVNKAVARLQEEFASKDHDNLDVTFCATAGVPGIVDVSLKGSVSRDRLQESMEKAGWEFEIRDGLLLVPKSLTIHVIDERAMKTAAKFRSRIENTVHRPLETAAQVTTRRLHTPGAVGADDPWPEVVELRRKVEDLTRRIDETSAALKELGLAVAVEEFVVTGPGHEPENPSRATPEGRLYSTGKHYGRKVEQVVFAHYGNYGNINSPIDMRPEVVGGNQVQYLLKADKPLCLYVKAVILYRP